MSMCALNVITEMACPYTVPEKLLSRRDSANDVRTLGLTTNCRPAGGDADALPSSHFLQDTVNSSLKRVRYISLPKDLPFR